MEKKIGEIFEVCGEWYQCVKGDTCNGCVGKFQPYSFCKGFEGCIGKIFKKLEKVGEPYMLEDKKFQKYRVFHTPYIYNKIEYSWQSFADPYYISLEIKQNKEDMVEKELTYEELLHYYHSTVGLWAIDRNPQEVHFDWICKNAFQLGTNKILSNFEKNGKNLKPFDLEAAKAGKPVCTRDGRSVRIICFNREYIGFPIIALIKNGDTEGVYQFDDKGRSNIDDEERGYDLMMIPEKKEGWVNIYAINTCYSSKEEAEANIDKDYEHEYVRTVKINWEE